MIPPRRLRSTLLASALLATAPAPAGAEESGWQVGAALASAVYAPAKLAYAAVGAAFGGIAWGLSGGDAGVLQAVVDPAVRGDYLVTPAHLRGERRIAFFGEAPDAADREPTGAEQAAADVPYGPYDEDGY